MRYASDQVLPIAVAGADLIAFEELYRRYDLRVYRTIDGRRHRGGCLEVSPP